MLFKIMLTTYPTTLKKLSYLVLIFSLGHTSLSAQSGNIWDSGKKGLQRTKGNAIKKVSALKAWKNHVQHWGLDSTYAHYFSLAGKLNTDGWSAGIVYGHKKQKDRDISWWQLTFSEVKHEKGTKQQGTNKSFPELGNSSSYIFGKINNLYLLNLGYGKERVLLPSLIDGNVSVGFRYSGGLSLAMLKPYYLSLIYPDYSANPVSAIVREERYSDESKTYFLNYNSILGKANWSKGLNEIQYFPGIFAEAEFSILPAKGKNFIQVITLGAQGSCYINELKTIAEANTRAYRACLFASLEFGKRWK